MLVKTMDWAGGADDGVIFQGVQTPSPPSPSGYAHVYANNQNIRPDLGPNGLTLTWFT